MKLLTKFKDIVLDYLPLIALYLIWAPLNIGTAFFYTLEYYHIVNLLVNIIGVLSFWLSIKYHNKYLNNKVKEKQGIPYDIIGDGIMVARADDVRRHAKKQFDAAAKIVPTVTEGKLNGGNGCTRNPPIPENYTKPKQPPCPPPPPSREYKCTFFGFVETQESIDKTNKYKDGNNSE